MSICTNHHTFCGRWPVCIPVCSCTEPVYSHCCRFENIHHCFPDRGPSLKQHTQRSHNYNKITLGIKAKDIVLVCELTFAVFAVSLELVVAATFAPVLLVPQVNTPVLTATVLHRARVHHWRTSHTQHTAMIIERKQILY